MADSGAGAGGAKQFFQKHGKILTFVGAIIVFSTFIIKDELRESWRQSADAIDTPQYIYLIRVDTAREDSTLRNLNEGISGIYKILISGKAP
jgi:hypothetical protein